MNEGSRPASRGYTLPLERGSRESHYRERKVANHGTNPTSLGSEPHLRYYPVIKMLPAELFRDVLEDDFGVS